MESLTLYEANYPIEEKLTPVQVYSKLVQWGIQTSSKHDRYLKQQLDQEFLKAHQSWVITQNQLRIEKMVDETKSIQVTTRVTQANRFFIQRYYEYFQQNQRIAAMTTQFVAIDLETRRLVRLNQVQQSLDQVIDSTYSQTLPQLTTQLPADWDDRFEPVIESNDIDENNHVNNLIYLRWILNHLETIEQDASRIQQIDIKYSQELLAEDHVIVKGQCNSNYYIYKQSGESLAAYVQLTWNEMEEQGVS